MDSDAPETEPPEIPAIIAVSHTIKDTYGKKLSLTAKPGSYFMGLHRKTVTLEAGPLSIRFEAPLLCFLNYYSTHYKLDLIDAVQLEILLAILDWLAEHRPTPHKWPARDEYKKFSLKQFRQHDLNPRDYFSRGYHAWV